MDIKPRKQHGAEWPKEAVAFMQLFADTEGQMKRGPFRKGRKFAEADWAAFADRLTDAFFTAIRESKKADTLIRMPPKKLLADGAWEQDQPAALANVRELFSRGLCAVRNNLIHGNKYVGADPDRARDSRLIAEATYVLQQARKALPKGA